MGDEPSIVTTRAVARAILETCYPAATVLLVVVVSIVFGPLKALAAGVAIGGLILMGW